MLVFRITKTPIRTEFFEPKMHSRSSLDHPARRSRGQSYRQWTILRAQPARYIPCHGTGRAGRCLRKAGLTHCAAASPARGVSAVAIAEPNLARAVHFLPVGQCVTLRPIDPRDADVLQAYVRRLSPGHVIPNACLQGDRGEARPPPYRRLLYFIAQRSNGADPHAPSAPVPFRAGADFEYCLPLPHLVRVERLARQSVGIADVLISIACTCLIARRVGRFTALARASSSARRQSLPLPA